MINNMENANKWLDKLEEYSLPKWDEIPSMNLYMDQLINYLEDQLGAFEIGDEQLVTSYMINNYVKGKVIPSPNSKRYGKEHVSLLLGICLLKQVVSLNDLKFILDLDQRGHAERKHLYDYFKKYHDEVLSSNVKELKKELAESQKLIDHHIGKPDSPEKEKTYNDTIKMSMTFLAFKHAIEAEVHRTLCEKMINEFINEENK